MTRLVMLAYVFLVDPIPLHDKPRRVHDGEYVAIHMAPCTTWFIASPHNPFRPYFDIYVWSILIATPWWCVALCEWHCLSLACRQEIDAHL